MSWSKTAKKNLAKQQERLDKIHRVAMFTLSEKTVTRSPVDTGRFRANWVASYGSIDRDTFSSNSRDSVGDINLYLRGNPVTANLLYITNSLPYSIRLEYGWSEQAPNGIVRLTARNFPSYVRQAIKQVKL